MEGLIILLIILIISVLLSGPIALIISIVALNKIKGISGQLESKGIPPVPTKETTMPRLETPKKQPDVPVPPTVDPKVQVDNAIPILSAEPKHIAEILRPIAPPRKPKLSIEQSIGTRWIPIAGVITLIVGVGFSLKYAYDNNLISPLGRVVIAAFAGIICLAVGEITRRRGYETVAKGTTALGFAILYAADFSAYQFYELIGTVPAFAAAITITAAAMAYAVVLNEVVAAFLALLGGFITPVIVSTGENMPVPLFGYVMVLSVGAMLCAYKRKWRAINLLAFAGTFLLYTGWFEKFFRPQLYSSNTPNQMTIALGWLGGFFCVYLVLPLLYGLVNKIKARKDDVLLVLINASWTFYYLWTILFERHSSGLAFCSAGLSAAHFTMMVLAAIRCRDDNNLRQILLALALVLVTVAIPLYWRMNAAALGWAIEGLVLVFIGIRYRSLLTQLGGFVSLGLACAKLIWLLPMHPGSFRLALNPEFGVWVFVSAALWVCHFLYRRVSQSDENLSSILAQLFYALFVILLACAATLEWSAHCKYNLALDVNLHNILRGQSLILAAAALLFAVKPLYPQGRLSDLFNFLVLAVVSIFFAFALTKLHTEKFLIFANADFAAVFLLLISVLGCHLKYRIADDSPDKEYVPISQVLYAVLGLLFLALFAAEWYWHCVYNLGTSGFSPALIRGQIIVFSAGVLGFALRPLCPFGILPKLWAAGLAVVGSAFAVTMYTKAHTQAFVIFANPTFVSSVVLIAAMFASSHLLYRRKDEEPQGKSFAVVIALLAIFVLWVLLSEEIYEYWHCRNLYITPVDNWEIVASMWMSVAWAVYGSALLAGGFWRRLNILRYIGLGILGMLLLKVFIVDMSAVSTMYRIMAFLATGVTLVGVSYLYQYLKKKGFFDTTMAHYQR